MTDRGGVGSPNPTATTASSNPIMVLCAVLGKVFSEFYQSDSWGLMLAKSELWESVIVLVNILIILLVGVSYIFLTLRNVQKKNSSSSSIYQPRPYIPPLNIAKEFRERWRTRWKHQQYHVRLTLISSNTMLIYAIPSLVDSVV